MGTYIVATVLFIFFIGSISLLMDSLYQPKQYEKYNAPIRYKTATVILEDESETV